MKVKLQILKETAIDIAAALLSNDTWYSMGFGSCGTQIVSGFDDPEKGRMYTIHERHPDAQTLLPWTPAEEFDEKMQDDEFVLHILRTLERVQWKKCSGYITAVTVEDDGQNFYWSYHGARHGMTFQPTPEAVLDIVEYESSVPDLLWHETLNDLIDRHDVDLWEDSVDEIYRKTRPLSPKAQRAIVAQARKRQPQAKMVDGAWRLMPAEIG